MNRFLIVVGLLLILLMGSCQMPIPGPVEEGLFSLEANFGRTIVKTTDSEEGIFIHPTPDGGFVSLLETLTDHTERNIVTNVKAVKLDANGANDWVFSPELSSTFMRTGVFVLPNPFSLNKRYLIGIQKINMIDYNTNVELIYVDENGDEIWHMEYPASDRDLLTGALFTSENTVMVYGKTNSTDGVFEGKNQSTGYDGFVLEIDLFNGESRQTFLYDYLEGDNGINRIYKTPDSPELFFVGEARNAANVQKIWFMRTFNFHATFKSQALFGNNDDFVYIFGGLRRIGVDEYVLASTKRMLDNERMAFYKFRADELLSETNRNFDIQFDPKINWALNNIHLFPKEVNKVSYSELLRIPGIGPKSAQRILKERKFFKIKYDNLKKMGVVLKRAKYFLTCDGRYFGGIEINPELIKYKLGDNDKDKQLSFF